MDFLSKKEARKELNLLLNNDLTELVEFFYYANVQDRYNYDGYFFDMYGIADSFLDSVIQLVDISQTHQPTRYFRHTGYATQDHDEYYEFTGYKRWVSLFTDNIGYYIDIFYPKKYKQLKGECISVLFCGCFIRGYVEWEHGRDGLFQYIYILILLESYMSYNREGTETVIDCLNRIKEDFNIFKKQYTIVNNRKKGAFMIVC